GSAPPARPYAEIRRSFPKSGQVMKGSIHLEFRRCGKPVCRCTTGHLHGPYFVRRWREGGRQRKAYVPRDDLAITLLAVEERRRNHVSRAQIRRLMSTL